MLRLQHENKLLKLQRSSTTKAETELIQTQLEDTKARNSELESELRYVKKKSEVCQLSAVGMPVLNLMV